MPRRSALALAAGLGLLSLASCGRGNGAHSSASTTIAPTTAAETWSGSIALAHGADLSVVSCPVAGFCLAGSTSGAAYRLSAGKVAALGTVVPLPSPQGVSYLSCASTSLCAAAPSLNQVTLFNGTSWAPPVTIPGAQGFTAIDCVAPSFCVAIDGEGNAFSFNGSRWSGNLGAWGAANQISCTSPQFCVAAEGGPSVWNGHTWTQPTDVDTQGQLNSVSCANATFCVAVDSNGNALTWNGTAFSAPVRVAIEPPLSGTDSSGLTGVSCPTATFCRAVDSIGRVFAFDGTTWTTGTLIDNGNALTSISCPTARYCAAVDRAGNAFVAGSAPKG